ncbi:TonB-dependent receptor plug domain-containing protein [Niveibacterium terrae]|uniref:TonB-dependent receptor plug domain-containing protein n=1 Tax=Niveibacterium terrae TaxID=3373598 RepID=UPI003A95DCEA
MPLIRLCLTLLLPLCALPAAAADAADSDAAPTSARPAPNARIEIRARKQLGDTEERRHSTAAKMVFGREELDRHGDTSLGDVLKRLPGITLSGTPGRGGDIRMRGLGNGYTQILINGEPAPRGFSLDSLAPDQVERIEVMRAPVAEHSARAIAGTINIVLREGFVKRDTEIRSSLGWDKDKPQPSLSVQKSGGQEAFNYSLNMNLGHSEYQNFATSGTEEFALADQQSLLAQQQTTHSRSQSNWLHSAPRLGWKFDDGDTVNIQPFAMVSRSHSDGNEHLDQSLGATPARYADAHWFGDSDFAMLRLMGNAKTRLADGARLEFKLNGGFASSDNASTRGEFGPGGNLAHSVSSSSGIKNSSLSSSLKYSRSLGEAHSASFGAELEGGHRTESATTVQDGVLQLAEYGDEVEAGTRRFAAWGQDEWEISPLWSLYAGLRWETIETNSSWLSGSASNSSSVASPLLHSVWRFAEKGRDQVRLGLTRSYKAPNLNQLVPRPTLSSTYPTSEANLLSEPDSSGNPNLKPELAWGLDLALEHYLGDGGLFSASLFGRDIDNLIRNVTSLQSVSWSPVQRWVSSPQNIGHARTWGIELEAKFKLTELYPTALPFELRANLSRYWSHVSTLPGPDNRLDQQPSLSGNLGVDYRFAKKPLTVGTSLNWTPAYDVRQSENQIYTQGAKRVLDAYALWRFDANTQLRLSAANLLAQNYDTGNTYFTSTSERIVDTQTRTYRAFTLRFEKKI